MFLLVVQKNGQSIGVTAYTEIGYTVNWVKTQFEQPVNTLAMTMDAVKRVSRTKVMYTLKQRLCTPLARKNNHEVKNVTEKYFMLNQN